MKAKKKAILKEKNKSLPKVFISIYSGNLLVLTSVEWCCLKGIRWLPTVTIPGVVYTTHPDREATSLFIYRLLAVAVI